jgi:transcriptional regulator NrdR family protein
MNKLKRVRTRADCKHCELCGSDSFVVDSRCREGRVYRRRVCQTCGHRWSTLEMKADKGEKQ